MVNNTVVFMSSTEQFTSVEISKSWYFKVSKVFDQI